LDKGALSRKMNGLCGCYTIFWTAGGAVSKNEGSENAELWVGDCRCRCRLRVCSFIIILSW